MCMVWGMYGASTHMYVGVHAYVCSQRPEELGVLLCHVPPYSLKSGSLPEPGARPVTSNPPISFLHSPEVQVHVCGHPTFISWF